MEARLFLNRGVYISDDPINIECEDKHSVEQWDLTKIVEIIRRIRRSVLRGIKNEEKWLRYNNEDRDEKETQSDCTEDAHVLNLFVHRRVNKHCTK